MTEGVAEFLQVLAEGIFTALDFRSGLRQTYKPGTRLRARTGVTLSGRDRRQSPLAQQFVVSIPAGAIVRIELWSDHDTKDTCVCLVDRTAENLIPAYARPYTSAFGYVLLVEARMLHKEFEVVE